MSDKWLVCVGKICNDNEEKRKAVEEIGRALAKEMGITVFRVTTMDTFSYLYFKMEAEKQDAEKFAETLLKRMRAMHLLRFENGGEYSITPIS